MNYLINLNLVALFNSILQKAKIDQFIAKRLVNILFLKLDNNSKCKQKA